MCIELRVANQNDLQFLKECFNHCHEINDYANYFAVRDADPETEFISFQDHLFGGKLVSQDIIIVHRNNRDIGFFIQELDEVNMHLGGATFTHPHACKMSAITLGLAATIRGIRYGLYHNYKYIEFNVWHPVLSQNVKRILPNLKEYILYKEYVILFLEFEKVDKEYYQKCLSTYGVRDWDENFCFKAENI